MARIKRSHMMFTTPFLRCVRAVRTARTLGLSLALLGAQLAAAQVPLHTIQVAGTNVNTRLARALETEDGGAVIELVTNDDAPKIGWVHELVKLSGEGRELWRYRVPRSYDNGVVDFAVVGTETTVLLSHPDSGNARLDSASLLSLNSEGEILRSTRLELPDDVAYLQQPSLTKLPDGWALNAVLVGEPSWGGPAYTLGFRASGERFAQVSTSLATDPDPRRSTALAPLGETHLLRYGHAAVEVLRSADLNVVRTYSTEELGADFSDYSAAAALGDTSWLVVLPRGGSDLPLLLGFTAEDSGVERRRAPAELRGKSISALKGYASSSLLLAAREYGYDEFGVTGRATYYLTDTRLRSARRVAEREGAASESTVLRLGSGAGELYAIGSTAARSSSNQVVKLSELASGEDVLQFGQEGGLEQGPFSAVVPLGEGVLLRETNAPRSFFLSEDTPLRAVDSFSVSEGYRYRPTKELSLERPAGGVVLAYDLLDGGGRVSSHLRVLDLGGRLRKDIAFDGELGYLGRDERYGGDGFVAVVQEKGDSYSFAKSTLIRFDALGEETGRRVIPQEAYAGFSIYGASERPDGMLYLYVLDWDVAYDAIVDGENQVVEAGYSLSGERYFPRGPISAQGVDVYSPWSFSTPEDTLRFYGTESAPIEDISSLIVPEGYRSPVYRWEGETLLGSFTLDSAGVSYGAVLAFDYATGSVVRRAITEPLPLYTNLDYRAPGLSYETQVFGFTLGAASGINAIAVDWGSEASYVLSVNAPALAPARVRVVGTNVVTDEVRFTSTVDLARGVALVSVDGRNVYRLNPELIGDQGEAVYRAALPDLAAGAYVLRIGEAGAMVMRAGR